jgi:hypothetical protein
MRLGTEKGEGKLGAIFGFVVLAAAIYAGVNAGPIYLANWRLEDTMHEAALAAPNAAGDAVARKRVMEAVDELGLSDYIGAADVHVQFAAGKRSISASYEREVRFLPGWKKTITFNPSVEQIVF